MAIEGTPVIMEIDLPLGLEARSNRLAETAATG